MKRFVLSFCALFSVFWIMPMFVKAYTPEMEYVIDWLDSVNSSYTDNWLTTVENAWQDDRELLIYAYNPPNSRECFISTSGHPFYVSGNNVTMYERTVYYNNNTGGSILSNTRTMVDGGDNGLIKYFGTRSDVSDLLVDYDDLIFDPSIPVPQFYNIYGILPFWNLGGTVTPQFPIGTIFEDMQQYKIEVQVRYYTPSKIRFSGTRRSAFSEDWTINYNYESLMPSDWYALVTMQDDIQNHNLVLNDSDYYYSWNNFIVGYDSSEIEFILDPVFISATANTSIKAYAETEYSRMRNIGGCYGNQFEIMARNYYINNGNVYVGNWFHWNSLTPEAGTAEYSDDAKTDNVVNGVQHTVNSNDLPTGNSLSTVGEPTGNAYNPSTNIVIQSSVPNYPDYPTVADYNRDNILVNMIKTSQSMPQYFGQFNEFLKTAFSFIDPSVWAVIALGFTASIVIMVIKVL